MSAERRAWLEPWLASAGLAGHLGGVDAWCEEAGAAFLEEVRDNWEDVADFLGLEGAERERFGRDLLAARADPEAALEVFATAGAQYALHERLGQGATATVHRCARGDGARFAVKVVDLRRLRRQAHQESRLLREASILRTLCHERIVQLHDVAETADALYLVMDLVEGGELFDHIVSQPDGYLADAEARYVFVQLVAALQYIHSMDVVHRDLKPDNILIDAAASAPGRPAVKVSDFGHSKLIRDGYNRAETCTGTPIYWAPEVAAASAGGYDERADLWSLGVVLHVMLVGKYPFEGAGAGAGAGARQAEEPAFEFRRSRQTEELVRGLIRTKPRDRLPLAQCLRCPWVTEAEPGSLPEEGAVQHHPREVRLRRLPRAPRDVPAFSAELDACARRHRAAARLHLLEVVVSFSPDAGAAERQRALEELTQLQARHFPEHFGDPSGAEAEDDGPCARARASELEQLVSDYGSMVDVLGQREWRITIRRDNALRVLLPPGYPLEEPPEPVFECAAGLCPWFSEEEGLLWTPGEACIYQWVEAVKDALLPELRPPAPATGRRDGREAEASGARDGAAADAGADGGLPIAARAAPGGHPRRRGRGGREAEAARDVVAADAAGGQPTPTRTPPSGRRRR